MSDEPVTWHFGLMAERWGETIAEAPELAFFERAIARYGQPVLDLACGSGRLLLPLLRAGIDIEGCDISGDMLAQCRRKASGQGLTVALYEQPMHAFDLPRRYQTIYICDSFGLAGSRANDLAALRRCYHHLQEGGTLVLNIEAEYAFPEAWQLWLPENRRRLPEPWPEEGSRRVAADGSEHIAYFRIVDLDPLEQTVTREVRLEKWIGGERVAAEAYTLRGQLYFKNELLLMLQAAGFGAIAVTGGYSDEPATAEHEQLIFRASKRAAQ